MWIPRQIVFGPVAESAYNAQNAQFGLVILLVFSETKQYQLLALTNFVQTDALSVFDMRVRFQIDKNF